MTDLTQLVTNSQRIAPTRTESELKGRFVQYGRHRRLTAQNDGIVIRNQEVKCKCVVFRIDDDGIWQIQDIMERVDVFYSFIFLPV